MTGLTKQSYNERRATLNDQIRVAKDDHARAALNVEMGTGDETAVVQARGTIAALEDRVTGLDAAWELALSEAAGEAGRQERAERLAAVEHIRAQMKVRTKAIATLAKAMEPIAAAVKDFRDANDAIVAAARPYASLFGRDDFVFLRSATHPDVPLEQRVISALLYDAGICSGINGINGRQIADMIDQQTLDGYVGANNREILRLSSPMSEVEAEGDY